MTLLQRKIFLLAIACALIALLTLTACSGGDDDSDNDVAATVTEDSDNGDDDEDAEDPTEDSEEDEDTPEPTEDEDEDSDQGDSPVDVCGLLTQDEVETALGKPVEDGQADSNDPFFSCTWETEDFDDVTVEILTGDDEDLEFYYELTEESEEIDGIGDQAQYSELIGLEVLTANYQTTVTIFSFDLEEPDIKERTLVLGEKAIDRLDD